MKKKGGMLIVAIFIGCLLACIWYYVSSKNYPPKVYNTLQIAGENSKELKKVLDYYFLVDKNPLKFKAACFLISNMQNRGSKKKLGNIPVIIKSSYHYLDSLIRLTYFQRSSGKLFEVTEYLNFQLDTNDFLPSEEIIDSLLNWQFGNNQEIKSLKNTTKLFWKKSDSIRDRLLDSIDLITSTDGFFLDAKQIKSEWLIRHIENAFKMWDISPFAKNMSFNEFAETLLSYRAVDEAVDWDLNSDSCSNIFGDILRIGDNDLAQSIRNLNFYIYAADCLEDNGRNLGYLGFYDLLQFYKFDCDRHSEWTVRILNACGIPAYLDFTSGFFVRDKMHFGVSVRDSKGKYHHFTPKWQQIDDTAHSKLFSKVFRKTVSPQASSPVSLKMENEDVPLIFSDAHIKDVTDDFHKVSDIIIKCDTIPRDLNLGYVAIFTPNGWKPVGWGVVNRKKKTLEFKKIPVDAMYTAGFYINSQFITYSQPFFLNNEGNIFFIKPDYKNTVKLHLLRKYPLKPHLVNHAKNMIGSRIEAANKMNFSDAVILHTLKYEDIRDFGIKGIEIDNKRKFKYIRIVPPKGKMLNIAYLDFFTKPKDFDTASVITRPYILKSTDSSTLNTHNLKKIPFRFLPNSQNLDKLKDNNMETFISVTQLGIDLIKTQEIRQIRIAPRNANNGIVVGDQYKLYYFDHGWKEKDYQTAIYNYLDFDSVPTNTIYWLQNITGGKEELPFSYYKKRQVFLNNNEEIEFFGNTIYPNSH